LATGHSGQNSSETSLPRPPQGVQGIADGKVQDPLTHACVRVCAYLSETPAGGALNLALRHSAMVAAGTQTKIRVSASDDLRKRMLRSVPSKRVSLP
jgi:hypothetical protein